MRQGKNFAFNGAIKTKLGAFVSLTGYTGRAQLRRIATDIGTPVATFVVTVVNPVGPRPQFTVSLGATGTAAIQPGTYVFDVEFVNDLDADDVLFGGEGQILVTPEVTK